VKKRLSKIARDLKANISDVAEFLRANGYDCNEDPNEELSIEAVEIIKYNFPAFISEKKKQLQQQAPKGKKVKTEASQPTEQIPLELRIIEAASKEKKLIERIIGFTEFEWSFIVAKYIGECSQPVEFNLFDEVLCDLLLTEQLSEQKIGSILGFDTVKDPAEKEIVHTAINELKKDKMIDGDESIMWLTDTGKDYASNGVKFSTFTRNFELYFDLVGGTLENVKGIFSKLKSEKIPIQISNLPVSLQDIRKLAEYQAQEIHFPEKNYLLQSAEFINAESFKAKVWVVLLENFRDNSMRAIVYDEKQNIVIDALSEALNEQEEIKTELLEKLIKVDDEIEFTEEEKQDDQIQNEKELIQKQGEIDEAIDSQNTGKIKEIEKEVEAIKRHFNSLEFEVELKRLFDTTADTIWILSPWVRDFAFKNRIPFIQQYLKKGGKIFVAYSKNETDKGEPMVQEESMKKLLELEKNNFNFYFCELEPFHYKNVWLREDKGKSIYYSGSYNILSFFVSQGFKKIRQEKMTRMDWDDELQEQFDDVIKSFGFKYLNKAIEDFNSLCQNPPEKIDREYLQKLRIVDNSKLKPFINQGIDQFDEAYETLEETKTENLNLYRKKYFESKVEDYRKEVEELSRQSISSDRKRNLQNEFEKLREEFIDFMELQMTTAKDVAGLIENLKTFNLSSQHNHNKKRR
jgi:hypothetical protein